MIKETKKIGVKLIFAWFFSIVFILAGIGLFFDSLFSGILMFFSGIIIFPPFNVWLKKEMHIEITSWLKVLVVFILLILSESFIVVEEGINLDNSENVVENISQQNNLPLEEPNSPQIVKTSYSSEQEGYYLEVIDYKFDKVDDSWGKITEITFMAGNSQGSNLIVPDLLISIEGSEQNHPEKLLELTEWMSDGEYIKKTIKTDIRLRNLEETKIFKAQLLEIWGKVLVTVKFDTNFSEGFK